MYLQGNLQPVFDVLYEMGVIEPVLAMDWKDALLEMESEPSALFEVVGVVNSCNGDMGRLKNTLERYDEKTLSFLAMEVAREFADFHSRGEVH